MIAFALYDIKRGKMKGTLTDLHKIVTKEENPRLFSYYVYTVLFLGILVIIIGIVVALFFS